MFVNIGSPGYGESMEYKMLSKVIKKAAKNAGIDRRVYPHILRHSRAIILANHLTEAQMCEFFGWVQGSKIPRIYVHLIGRDINKAIGRIYGLEVEEEGKEKVAKPIRCPRRIHLNAPTDRYYSRCALILDEGGRLRVMEAGANLVSEILKDDKKIKTFRRFLELMEILKENLEVMRKVIEVFRNYLEISA